MRAQHGGQAQPQKWGWGGAADQWFGTQSNCLGKRGPTLKVFLLRCLQPLGPQIWAWWGFRAAEECPSQGTREGTSHG